VWAIIGRLETVAGDIDAAEYDVPRAAIEAAVAYYGRHKDAIDARREANRF